MRLNRTARRRLVHDWVKDCHGGVESPGLIFVVLAFIGASFVAAENHQWLADLVACGLDSWSKNFC